MDDNDNEFLNKAFERFAARQRDQEAFAEKISELVQNVVAAGMSEEMLQRAIERGMKRGIYLRDRHRSEADVIDIRK